MYTLKVGAAVLAASVIMCAVLLWALLEYERQDRERRIELGVRICGGESDARMDKWRVTMLPWEVQGNVVMLGSPQWNAIMEKEMKLRYACFDSIWRD